MLGRFWRSLSSVQLHCFPWCVISYPHLNIKGGLAKPLRLPMRKCLHTRVLHKCIYKKRIKFSTALADSCLWKVGIETSWLKRRIVLGWKHTDIFVNMYAIGTKSLQRFPLSWSDKLHTFEIQIVHAPSGLIDLMVLLSIYYWIF